MLACDRRMFTSVVNWCRNPPAHAPVEPRPDAVRSFEQDDGPAPGGGQVVGGAAPDDACADDDDVRRGHPVSLSAPQPRVDGRARDDRSSNARPTDSNTVTSSGRAHLAPRRPPRGRRRRDRGRWRPPRGDQEVARLGERRIARLDHDPCSPHRDCVHLALVGQVSADRVHVRPGGEHPAVEQRYVDCRARADEVRVGDVVGSATAAHPGRGSPLHQRRARSGVREMTVTRPIGRTASIASRCDRAWIPAPKITRRRASVRARWRVASPDTAAVRSAVSSAPSTIASGAWVSGSNRT